MSDLENKTPRKLIIGLTGGIGSGKSAASHMFEELGIDVVDADVVAREIVEPGTQGLQAIINHFGEEILDQKQGLDRSKLRQIVFNSPSEKQWLEKLLHPLIRTETIAQINASQSPYTILVSPLLFETDQHKLVDRTLLIDTTEALQIQRASARDKNSEAQIKAILDQQMPRACKQERANDIILNDRNIDALRELVEQQHLTYLNLSKTHQ